MGESPIEARPAAGAGPNAGGEGRPNRQEVIDAVAALAEDPAAVRHLLERGLGEAWWENLNDLNHALRLNGLVWAVSAEPAPALPAPNAARL